MVHCVVIQIVQFVPILYTVKPVLRGHLWDKEKVVFKRPLKTGLIHIVLPCSICFHYNIKPVLRGHLWDKEKWSLKTGLIHILL